MPLLDPTLHLSDILVIVGGLGALIKLIINGALRTIREIKSDLVAHVHADALSFQIMSEGQGRIEASVRDVRDEQTRVAVELANQHDTLLLLKREPKRRDDT